VNPDVRQKSARKLLLRGRSRVGLGRRAGTGCEGVWHIATIRHKLFQPVAELVLGDELGDAAAHDVVAIAESTREDDELSLVQRGRFELGDGQHFSGEPG
jgi:hypothetical protein